MQNAESQMFKGINAPKAPQTPKTTEKAERVGEEWPRIISKKWLAWYFGFVTPKGNIAYRQFRKHVLTPELLEKAGISPDVAYSNKTRMFSAIQSMNIKQILAPSLILALLAISTASMAQQTKQLPHFKTADLTPPAKETYSRDSMVIDTLPGLVVYQDSLVRMIEGDERGTYRYQKVSSSINLDGMLIRKYRYLVRGSDGGLEPFDLSQTFHFLNGDLIDERRILLFKASPKPAPKK